jgi:hypothetical protein
MAKTVQAKCPGCQAVLRIPVDWVHAKLRCKHCGMVLQAKQKATNPRAEEITQTPKAQPAPVRSPAAPQPSAPRARTIPGSEVESAFSQLDAGLSEVTERYRLKHRRSRMPVAVAAAGTIIAVIVLVCLAPDLRNKLSGALAAKRPVAVDALPPTSRSALTAVAPVFPRRVIGISVSNYFYATPVNAGAGAEEFDRPGKGSTSARGHGVLNRLADALHVPADQRVELSDSLPSGAARPPLKSSIEATVSDCLDTSRAQDRVLILFVGHAVELGENAYLVPIEGELTDSRTLIPLTWIYDRLAKCKARQKVLIVDVCRWDPSREQKPLSRPMDPKLGQALANPPAGVQVWSACVERQHSLEGFLPHAMEASYGGLFFNELYEAAGSYPKKQTRLGMQQPADSLPIELIAKGDARAVGVNRATEADAEELYKAKQTPRLAGREPAGGAPPHPEEPLPSKLVIREPEPPGGRADKNLIAGILNEVDQIPPLTKTQGLIPHLEPEMLTFLSAKVMAPYKDDGARTPFREAIHKTIKVLQREQIANSVMEEFRGKGNDAALKERILTQQRKPAIIQADLEEALSALQKVGDDKDTEPSKRWQATYDYVLALLQARIAYVYEYNYMLGQIRKDALPPRDPAVHTGWRLVPQEKLQSGSEAKKMADASRKLLEKLVTEHKGTPYEILAKREKLNLLGLEWKPTR